MHHQLREHKFVDSICTLKLTSNDIIEYAMHLLSCPHMASIVYGSSL